MLPELTKEKKTSHCGVKLEPDQHERLRKLAVERDSTVSREVRLLIRDHLAAHAGLTTRAPRTA